jgi:hypothetical protein
MRKAENRQRYNRDKLRYPSDLTDAEWSRDDPPARRGGRQREVDVREVVNGVIPRRSWCRLCRRFLADCRVPY